MTRPPFTDWADVPLVCRVDEAARTLNRSRRAIERDLAAGTMTPAPRRRQSAREPWTWSKADLMAHVNDVASSPGRRRFFGKARTAAVRQMGLAS